MLQQTPQEPIVFRTRDGLLTFTFTLGEDPSGSHGATLVMAEIALGETPAPAAHGPITVAIYQDGPTRLAHSPEGSAAGSAAGSDGQTLAGTLALQPHGHRQIAVVADLFYGERGGHHLAEVLASFPVAECHAPAWVLCGCSGSAPRHVTGDVTADVTGDMVGHVAG